MSLVPPATVGKLQAALQAKAKQAPSYRFYALYDKIYRADILAYAYARCRANGGAAGVDEETFEPIEANGRGAWLGALADELRPQTYVAHAVRRVWLPKPDGKQRPLGIPTVKDRVVQTAVLVVLEPIFEADLPPEPYAYRPGRSAREAVRHVQRWVIDGHREVVDADWSGYCDSIPHAELMRSVARRVSDRHVLWLIKRWLEAPVAAADARGQLRRTTRNKDEGRGTPQGAPIAPLWSNLYMRRFLLGWKVLGHQRRLDAHVVNYADDFVICCRGSADEALAAMRAMMVRLRLTVNETKTRVCRGAERAFDFLGYTIGWLYSPQTGGRYLGVRPSDQKVRRLWAELREQTSPRWQWLEPEEMVGRLNAQWRGWAGYFCLGTVTKAYRQVTAYTGDRLRQWLARKSKVQGSKRARFSNRYLHERLGLLRLQRRPARAAWAHA